MAIWLIARALNTSLPRRLIYVVDRRTVVDQATDIAEEFAYLMSADPKKSLAHVAQRKPELAGRRRECAASLDDVRQPDVNIRKVHPNYASSRQCLPRRESRGCARWSGECCRARRWLREVVGPFSGVAAVRRPVKVQKRPPASRLESSRPVRIPRHRFLLCLESAWCNYRPPSRRRQRFDFVRLVHSVPGKVENVR